MKRSAIGAIVLGSIVFGPGCAAFKANNLPVVSNDQFKIDNSNKIKVFSRWTLQTNNSMANDQTRAAGAAIHKDYFEKALKESGCCDIAEGPTEADVVIDGVAYDENNPAAVIPAFITGLSLFTIPSWVTAKVYIAAKATYSAKETNYDLSDSMTMVQWLPMIFAMPFTGTPMTVGKEVDSNVYRNLVIELKDDGLLGANI